MSSVGAVEERTTAKNTAIVSTILDPSVLAQVFDGYVPGDFDDHRVKLPVISQWCSMDPLVERTNIIP
jgi:hypothetical protein